jgi:hypothetical protein
MFRAHDEMQKKDRLLHHYLRQGGNLWITIFVWVSVLLTISYNAGNFSASRVRQFLVKSTDPNKAIVSIYGDNIVGVSFDRESRTFEKAIFITKLSQTESLRWEMIGPLRPKTP